MTQIKIALIGLGYWGKNHLRTFGSLPEAEIVSCCDITETNFSTLRKTLPNCQFTTSLQDVFQNPLVEGVVIATPSITHHEIAKACLQAGKHTFVEKPIAMNLKEAEELVALAKTKKRILMVGHLLKHHPVIHYLKKLIDSGEFGEINYIYTQRLNLGVIRTDENPLWSLSPHDISIILYLLNEMPIQVSAIGASFLQKGIEDVIFARMSFKTGHLAHMHLSWLDPHKTRSVTIVGSKKMAVFDDMEPREKLRLYDKGATKSHDPQTMMEYLAVREGDIFIPQIEATEPLRLECQNFIRSIQEKETVRSDGEEAVRILKIMTLLDESLKNSGKVINL